MGEGRLRTASWGQCERTKALMSEQDLDGWGEGNQRW